MQGSQRACFKCASSAHAPPAQLVAQLPRRRQRPLLATRALHQPLLVLPRAPQRLTAGRKEADWLSLSIGKAPKARKEALASSEPKQRQCIRS